MKRDYTEETLNKLKKQIRDINDSDFCELTDLLGDVWYYFQACIGVLRIENYLYDTQKYHRKVLDQHDTTIKELNKIFTDARMVDFEYSKKMNKTVSLVNDYIRYIKRLTYIINPQMKKMSAGYINTVANDFKNSIASKEEENNNVYEELLLKREIGAMADASKDFLLESVSAVKNIFDLTVHMADKDVLGCVSDIWNLVNAPFRIGEELVALVIIPLGFGLSKITGYDKSMRVNAVAYSEDFHNRDGLVGEMKDSYGDNSKITKVTKAIDDGVKVVEVIDVGHDILSKASDLSDVVYGEKTGNSSKVKDVIEVLLDRKELPEEPFVVDAERYKGALGWGEKVLKMVKGLTENRDEEDNDWQKSIAKESKVPGFGVDTGELVFDTIFVN